MTIAEFTPWRPNRRFSRPLCGAAVSFLVVAAVASPRIAHAQSAVSRQLTHRTPPDASDRWFYLYYAASAYYMAGKYADAALLFENFVSHADPSDLGDAFLYLGDSYSRAKEYAKAIRPYTTHLLAYPDDKSGAALKGRALSYLMLHKNQEATQDYRKYLLLQPNDMEAQNNVLVALSDDKSVPADVLIHQLQIAIANDPTNVTFRITLAAKQMEAKDYAAAITQYDAILAAKPDDSAAMYNRGVAYGLLKELPKAAADFATYTKLKPTDPAGWNNLGVFLGQAKDNKGSAAAFTQYISLHPTDPDFIEAYKNRGIAYYNLDDFTHALADLVLYDATKPGDKDVLSMIATCLSKIGADATTSLLEMVRKDPTNADAWFKLGVGYLDEKQNAKAVEAFTKAISLARRPEPDAYFNRALAYSRLGDAGDTSAYTRAEADCTSVLVLKPDYAAALLLRADAEHAEHKDGEASTDYRAYIEMQDVQGLYSIYAHKRSLQAYIDDRYYRGVVAEATALIELDPSDAQMYLVRGIAYVAMKSFDLALRDLHKYAAMRPVDPMGFFNLGCAYSGKNDLQNAAANFEKASALNPALYDAASQAATFCKKMADADQKNLTTAASEYDRAIALYDKAANIPTATPNQRADALYNEAATREAKVRLQHSEVHLKFKLPSENWNWLRLAIQ